MSYFERTYLYAICCLSNLYKKFELVATDQPSWSFISPSDSIHYQCLLDPKASFGPIPEHRQYILRAKSLET